MDEAQVRDWFSEYLSVFAATGRGEVDPTEVVRFYAAPLLLTTDDVVVSVGTEEEIAAWVQTQVDGMLAASYDRTETLSSDLTIVNRNTALHRAEFSRQRADGEEISRLTVTYLITRAEKGLGISALLLHSA